MIHYSTRKLTWRLQLFVTFDYRGRSILKCLQVLRDDEMQAHIMWEKQRIEMLKSIRISFSDCSYCLFNWNIKPNCIKSSLPLFILFLPSQAARAVTMVCPFWSAYFILSDLYYHSFVHTAYQSDLLVYIRKIANIVRNEFSLLKYTCILMTYIQYI